MDCLCGYCSRKQNEGLEERKQRALSLEWYKPYTCTNCGVHFYISHTGFTKSHELRYIQALFNADSLVCSDILEINNKELVH